MQYSANFGGSTLSGEMLANAMLEEGWELHVLFGFDGPFLERMAGVQLRTHIAGHSNWLRSPRPLPFLRNCIRELSAANRMARLLREIDPDVVYVNSLVSFAGVVAAKLVGVPIIWHLRELFDDINGEMRWPARCLKPLIRWFILYSSAAVIVNSQAVKKNVLGDVQSEKVSYIPNAVPDYFFKNIVPSSEARQKLGLAITGPIVGFPGTIRPVKGHITFLNAVSEIVKAYPDCRFLITGAIDSDYAREIVYLTRNTVFSNHIIFVGVIADMQTFYRACDVCCIASESESFGRAAIEAFACKVPLVSTTAGGLAEIVVNQENGLTFEIGNSSQLARCVINLLKDKALSGHLVENGFRKALACYSYSRCGGSVISVIKTVVLHSQLKTPLK